MRFVLATLALLLTGNGKEAPSLAQATLARPTDPETYAAAILAESGRDACLVRLDVTAILGREPFPAGRGAFIAVRLRLRAVPVTARPGPNNPDPASCGEDDPSPAAADIVVIFPPAGIAEPPAPPASIEAMVEPLPGFAPYGVGGGVLVSYVRRAAITR